MLCAPHDVRGQVQGFIAFDKSDLDLTAVTTVGDERAFVPAPAPPRTTPRGEATVWERPPIVRAVGTVSKTVGRPTPATECFHLHLHLHLHWHWHTRTLSIASTLCKLPTLPLTPPPIPPHYVGERVVIRSAPRRAINHGPHPPLRTLTTNVRLSWRPVWRRPEGHYPRDFRRPRAVARRRGSGIDTATSALGVVPTQRRWRCRWRCRWLRMVVRRCVGPEVGVTAVDVAATDGNIPHLYAPTPPPPPPPPHTPSLARALARRRVVVVDGDGGAGALSPTRTVDKNKELVAVFFKRFAAVRPHATTQPHSHCAHTTPPYPHTTHTAAHRRPHARTDGRSPTPLHVHRRATTVQR